MYTLVLQILVSVVLIVFVILQAKGTGLSGVLGGTTSYHAKRGVEKSLFYATIVAGICFVALALLNAI